MNYNTMSDKNMICHTQLPLALATILLIGIALLSCSKTQNQASIRDTLRVVLTGNPSTLDPQATSATITAQVNRSIYDTLLAPPNGTPLLAESWEASDDKTVWTFTLKQNVVFHNGSPLNAADVIATLKRMRNPEMQSDFATELENFIDISQIDDTKFSITLQNPDAAMPIMLASSHMAILPKALIDRGHDFSRQPVGTGPFAFESWDDDTSIVLSTHKQYHAATPSFETLKFFVITDVHAQAQAIIRGDVDIIPYLVEPELSLLESKDNIDIVSYTGSTILLLAINTRISPFNTLETRKALAKGIDKQKIIDIAYPSSRKTNLFWHSNSNYFVQIPEIFDPEAAKEYFRINPIDRTIVISVPQNFAPHVKAAQIYQTMLQDMGIKARVEKVEWGTWLDRIYSKGQFDLTVIGHTGKLSPGQRLKLYAETGGYVGWQNEEFRSLINGAKVARDEETQTKLYKNALQLITEEYPFVFVAENSVNFAIRSNITHMQFDPVLETYNFTSVVIE